MHTTLKGKVEISADGADWLSLPGVSQVNIQSKPPPVRNRRDFGGVIDLVGRPGKGRVQVTIPALVVGDRTYALLEGAYRNSTDLHVRVSYPPRTLAVPSASAQIISIAGDGGLVMLSPHGEHVNFQSPAIEPGVAIQTDSGQLWVIREITDTGTVYVYTENGVGSGTTGYTVVVPGVKTAEVQCAVTNFGNIVADANSTLGGSVGFQPQDELGVLTLGGFV